MKSLLAALALFFAFATVPAGAETYEDATLALCEKVKQCAMAQMGEQQMTPEQEQMMTGMMQNMCAGIQQNYSAPASSPHYGKATACMRSMADLSCAEFDQMSDDTPTKECAAFRAAAE